MSELGIFLEHAEVGVVALWADGTCIDRSLYGAAGLVGVGAGSEAALLRGSEHFGKIKGDLLLFEVHEAEASKARIRAMENALKESTLAEEYASKVANFISEGFDLESGE